MVNVNGGRDWSAATKDCPEFLGSLTQVKYFSTNLITVRAHRGHTWSEATQNPCKFLSTLGQSKNPEIQYFQKPHKNFKVLIKRFLLGSYDLPGFLDYWIIINLTRLWDQITGNSPISSNQSYQVPMQPRAWLERSDPDPLEVMGSHGKGRNVFLPHHSHTPIETKMRQDKKVER